MVTAILHASTLFLRATDTVEARMGGMSETVLSARVVVIPR